MNAAAGSSYMRGSISTALAVILGLIALGLSGFLYWRLVWNDTSVEQKTQLDTLSAELEQKTAGITDEVTRQVDRELGSELQSLTQQNLSIDQRLQAMETAVADLLTAPDKDVPASAGDWSIAEARFLLRAADFRLRTEADVKGALDLLREADQLYAAAADARFTGVREGIARDILALEALRGGVDVEGVYLAIEALKSALSEALAAAPALSSEQQSPQTQTPTPQLSAWDAFVERLTELARGRRVDADTVRPIPEEEERVYLERSIRLALDQAQLALLRGEQGIFEHSLQSVQGKLRSALPESALPESALPERSSARAALLTALEPLLQVKVASNFPNLASLQARFSDTEPNKGLQP